MELDSGEALRQEVLRRRGLFHWLEVVRPETLAGYAVQKITQNGATHFPEPATAKETV